jgi:hypothetical protein
MRLPQQILSEIGPLPAQCKIELRDGHKIDYCYVDSEGCLEGVITGGKEGIDKVDFGIEDIARIRRQALLSRWHSLSPDDTE